MPKLLCKTCASMKPKIMHKPDRVQSWCSWCQDQVSARSMSVNSGPLLLVAASWSCAGHADYCTQLLVVSSTGNNNIASTSSVYFISNIFGDNLKLFNSHKTWKEDLIWENDKLVLIHIMNNKVSCSSVIMTQKPNDNFSLAFLFLFWFSS